MKSFHDFGIDLEGKSGLWVAAKCPECSESRKKKNVRCLGVNTEENYWICHHCGWKGSLKKGTEDRPKPNQWKRTIVRKPDYNYGVETIDSIESWFIGRGISRDVLDRNKIMGGSVYMPQQEDFIPVIQFPYFRDGQVVNVKYRGQFIKVFRQETGAEKILYGLDDMSQEYVVIVEGEIDKLSFEMAGVLSCISVPDGAPNHNMKNVVTKFEYLDNCIDRLDPINKIILAVDDDPPGLKLEEELARRFGHERCWRVEWPESCKDANEVLLTHGADRLKQCIDEAKPYPLEGIFEGKDLVSELTRLYYEGLRPGVTTGWFNVNEFFTVRAGELTILTGIPGHGKSEWLDDLMVNVCEEHKWRFGVFSPENAPIERHISKLIEKKSGFPFRVGPSQRLSIEDALITLEWINEHMFFIEPPEEDVKVETILTMAKQMVRRYGIQGLIIDPWNEFDHTRPKEMTETEYISRVLTRLRRFARVNKVHVFLVAHPQKLKRKEDGSYPVPGPYEISGSAHWWNRADNCLCIWRDLKGEDRRVSLHVQKIKFKEVGKLGCTTLEWNPVTGNYSEYQETEPG